MSDKYWFVVYEWRHRKRGHSWNTDNKIIKEHPIKWLERMRSKYGEMEEHNILFYRELPQLPQDIGEQYQQFFE